MDNLASNLEYLMNKSGLTSQHKLHMASGVSQAHIGNILRREKSPGVYVLDRLASTFGIETWQLLAPRDILDKGIGPDVTALVNCFLSSDDQGKRTILSVAESQAHYRPGSADKT